MNLRCLAPLVALACLAEARVVASDPQVFATSRHFKIPRVDAPGFPPVRSDPAKVAIGERLFLETRFSHYFFAHSNGDANATLAAGDPVVENTTTLGAPLPGPFSGFAINCRACHLLNEHFAGGHGNRTYTDFARRSPVPSREDGQRVTLRNSPPMVNATVPRDGSVLLHYDGEFAGAADLARGTLTGRNYGWLAGEQALAVRHIARIIREDDGQGPLAREFGGFAYRDILLGTNAALGEPGKRFRLPPEFRFDAAHASDDRILDTVGELLAAYMDSLLFSRNENWDYEGSPYDAFLETNQFPHRVDSGASEPYYNRHLADLFLSVRNPVFVHGTNGVAPPAPGRFKTLEQDFRFGPLELAGARVFFSTPQSSRGSGIGNCVACHSPPNFTDFHFHNTGAAQLEYDAIHGAGMFAKLKAPGLARRNAQFNEWLPATSKHPNAAGPFLDIPAVNRPGRTDLGLWNVFANPDQPRPQDALRALLNGDESRASDADLLPRTIALFKTPTLRGLGFSHPYLHNGSRDTLEDVIRFYIKTSALARAGKLRNGAPELAGMHLSEEHIEPLAAFLKSLNEDYE